MIGDVIKHMGGRYEDLGPQMLQQNSTANLF